MSWIPHTLAVTLLALAPLLARADPAPSPAPAFSGQALDGRSYELASRRGRVVMVLLWRSDCAVCLSKLPELRANTQGWKSAPFDLVLVNLDATSTDAQAYDRARRQIAADESGVFSFWHGDTRLPPAWRSGEKLPRTMVIDRAGRLAYTHEGRIPPEVWNQVADLLP